MASTSVRDDQTLIWQAKCNDDGFAIPIRQITSTQDVKYDPTEQEELDMDNTFHASETQVPAPRYLDYKSESAINENLTHDTYELSVDHLESQIVPDEHRLILRENDVVHRNHVMQNEDVSTNFLREHYNYDDVNNDSAIHGQVSTAEKLARRKSCPVPSNYDRSAKLSLPKQYSIGDPETIITEEEKEAEKAARNANLQEITSMIRKMSRPTLHKDGDCSSFDDDYSHTSTWLSGTDQVPSVNKMGRNHHGESEFDKYSEITMQTRKATKPKVSDLNFKSEKSRSRSVAHIQSPTVPALSPGRERFSFTGSFSSNSSSSSETFYPPNNVTDPCFRCGRQVYSLDKVGPIRRELFHKQCFRCFDCNTVLNLKNYCQNPNDKTDKQIYCKNHQPSQDSAHISLDDRNINIVMNNPKLDKVNTNIRGSEEDKAKSRNQRTFRIRGVASTPKLDVVCGQQYGFSYTNGNNMHDAGLLSPRSQTITSPREMRVDDIEPRRVWTRSSMNAAILDLSAPISGRNTHHFYDYGSRAFNHL